MDYHNSLKFQKCSTLHWRMSHEHMNQTLTKLKWQWCVVGMDGAVAWEPLLAEQEHQKFDKCQSLAANLATQHPGWRVDVIPMVAGCLGTLQSLRPNFCGLDLFTKREINLFCKEIQFEVLCSAMRLVRRHLTCDWTGSLLLATLWCARLPIDF